jgi:protein TIF31
VTAQSIIPGILDKDQEQSVVHGSTDFGKTCATNDKYNELLEKVCSHLKMRPHKIRVENNDEIMLYSSIECKGIIGNDSRYYLLDLLRMFPPDLNYLPCDEAENKLSDEMAKLSFPRKFRHKLCSLRQELVEAFVDTKYIQFVKYAAMQIQEMNSKRAAEQQKLADDGDKEIEDAKQLIKQLTSASVVEENSSQIIQNACKHINSFKEN